MRKGFSDARRDPLSEAPLSFQVSLPKIQESERRIAPFIRRTQLSRSAFFSSLLNAHVFFKWESEQEIKSFKIRGALNKILSLSKEERERGVIAASAGNHAQGVAYAARRAGVRARAVMMKNVSRVKLSAVKKYGAQVLLEGFSYDECYARARALKGDSVFIHPFADPLIIAGQGTLGLEILRQAPQVTSLVMSIGGGGLISGVAAAVRRLKPHCRIYGAVWDGTPELCRRFHKMKNSCLCGGFRPAPRCDASGGGRQGKNRPSESGWTDGIAVKKPAEGMLEAFAPFTDDIVCVSREETGRATAALYRHEGRVAEGSGAAPLAALMKRKNRWNLGSHCCLVISGGNIDPPVFQQILGAFPSESGSDADLA